MKILHLEDNCSDAEMALRLLTDEWPACDVTLVATEPAFRGELQKPHDLILSDFTLVAFNGLDALKLARRYAPETPFIFLSGTIGEDRAIEAVRLGAQDYVLKDRMKRLVTAIRQALKESEERQKRQRAERRVHELAAVLDQAREAVLITDLARRVVYWNHGAERLCGWKSEEALGQFLEQVLVAAGSETELQSAHAVACVQGEWHGEIGLRNREGAVLVVELRQTLVRDEAGQPKACLSIVNDITEQKKLQEQFLRVQRLESVGLLSAGIAHDLNNMLAPIVMAIPMLRDAVNDAESCHLLQTVEHSAERAVGLVRQILAFSKGMGSERYQVQMKHLLQDVVLFVAGTFPKNIQVKERISPTLWPVKANTTQIHQLLLNLCINARDAMPDGGVLSLRAENCLFDVDAAKGLEAGQPGAFLLLEIEDTGVGIPPDVLAHIWEPFYTTKAKGRGTGLGLSTVRTIVDRHQGFVSLQTAVGRGTTFRIYLPAVDIAPGEAIPPTVISERRGHGELILVVDDDRSIREVISAVLVKNGFRTLMAVDGAEALVIFKRHADDVRLLITDLEMPNLDGVALAREVRRAKPEIGLLMVSGLATAHDGVPERLAEFAANFIPKPFKVETLLAKVHELIPA